LKPTISQIAPAPTSPSTPPHELPRLTRADIPFATVDCAQFLVGTLLLRRLADGTTVGGRIVETEAYMPGDPSSHAYRGLTRRNRAMFDPHLHAYVYLIYGTAWCFNITTESAGVGAAVLVRAIEPSFGIDRMRTLRGPRIAERDLARGPGRLCAALDIGPALDGIDLETDPRLWLADDGRRPALGASTRIGLTRAAEREHRFYARGSRYLSGPRALSPALYGGT
jgi:DNA-3-methyladenine glycosylase